MNFNIIGTNYSSGNSPLAETALCGRREKVLAGKSEKVAAPHECCHLKEVNCILTKQSQAEVAL